ncbi:MAG: phage antirepressor [Clostridium sp.]
MSKEIQIIEQREVLQKDFKIYGTKENPLFLAKEVAGWIGYELSNVSKMVKNVDEDEKIIARTNNTSATFLTEDGLYEVLMQSRKEIAKKFKKEVKNILKQIRKTGGYIPIQEEDDPETIMAKALMVAQNTLNKKNELLKAKEQELIETKEELETKNKFMHQIAVSENSLLVREVAKVASKNGITIGEKRLWALLREWGLIFKNTTEPKQSGIDKGYFEVASGTREAKGKVFTYQTTRVTGKGQTYIIERLLKEVA